MVRLWKTVDLSLVIHNANDLADLMVKEIKEIGPRKVAMLVSDNVGSMLNARREVIYTRDLRHIIEHR
jgi:hypothetical protein